MSQTYTAICNYYQVAIGSGEGLSVEFNIEKLCASYNLLPVLVFNSIKFLEKENYLSFLDLGFEPSKVLFLAGKQELYEFQVKFPKFEALIKTLLRSYGGLFDNYVFINEKDLAFRVKDTVAHVLEHLAYLNQQEIISFVPQSSLPKLIFIQDRVNTKFVELDPNHYYKLKERYLERINSVIDYTNNNKVCRQVQLLMYFNEFNFSNCGHCDVCLANRPANYDYTKTKILNLLKKQPHTLETLKQKLKLFNDETWIRVFNELVDDGIVVWQNTGYKLK